MTSEQTSLPGHNYDSISPSARALLLLKGYTDIPFARKAAELISLPEKYEPDFEKRDFGFWSRVMHFEARYKSINQLLAGLNVSNILELSSGFSFRGLQVVQAQEVHYIDTDLPNIIDAKKPFAGQLQDDTPAKGKLEILPLNALDRSGFESIVNRFSSGPLVIVNEGLLMYLGDQEKKSLCKTIHDILKERGGYWITADIYVKISQDQPTIKVDDDFQQFLDDHKVRDNMFDSFEAAEQFFKEQGLILDKEAEPEYANASTLKYFMQSISPDQMEALSKSGNIHATWRFRVTD